jgi:hypothetical protein
VLYHNGPTFGQVLGSANQTLTCSQNWRNHSVGNASEALRRCLIGYLSNHTHQQRRRPNRNTILSLTLDRCDKAQWRLHWRSVNVFCKINSFLKRKHTVYRIFKWSTCNKKSQVKLSWEGIAPATCAFPRIVFRNTVGVLSRNEGQTDRQYLVHDYKTSWIIRNLLLNFNSFGVC